MRLLGVNLPDQKKIVFALTHFYGIGLSLAEKILKETNVDSSKKTKELTPEEINRIKEYIEKNCKVEGELRQIVRSNIERLKNISCYRGIRHIKRLPVRGQRTKTNSRTVRGNVRKTAGSGKRKVELK
ncbi:MAG: 30S ribosomal protein S13 [Candidatus Parcubacteria bacterium]|nr:MAG: 30S ribosomal protein S13 [Candidatus Parcubacteria bacterium]